MLQDLLIEAADEVDINVRAYSGRAMNGRECLAITGPISACSSALAHVVTSLLDKVLTTALDGTLEESDSVSSNAQRIVQDMFEYKQDQMGLDVVFYWPDISYTKTADEGHGYCRYADDGNHDWVTTHISQGDEPNTYKCRNCGLQVED